MSPNTVLTEVSSNTLMDIDSITEQAQQSQINNTMPSYTEQLKTENSQLKMLKACCRTFTEQWTWLYFAKFFILVVLSKMSAMTQFICPVSFQLTSHTSLDNTAGNLKRSSVIYSYCNVSLHKLHMDCLFIVTLHAPVCGFVFLSVGLLPRYLEIACIDPHQTGSVGKGSDHLQLIKFWPSCAPGKAVCGGVKIFGSALLQPAWSVCISSEHFFIYKKVLVSLCCLI